MIPKILILTSLCLFAGTTYARPAMEKADRMKESPENPQKKKAGEECQAHDDCRRHHRCKKQGERSVCVAPEPHEIPKT